LVCFVLLAAGPLTAGVVQQALVAVLGAAAVGLLAAPHPPAVRRRVAAVLREGGLAGPPLLAALPPWCVHLPQLSDRLSAFLTFVHAAML